EATRAAEELLGLAEDAKGRRDSLSVVSFGRDARSLGEGSGAVSQLGPSSLADSSDLYSGLRLASSAAAARGGGRAVIVSDGLYTGRDPFELLPRLHESSLRVDYWPVKTRAQKDVAISRVELPERVRAGEPFQLMFEVQAPSATEATLSVESASSRRKSEVSLQQGTNRFTLRTAARRPGLVRRTIRVAVSGDERPENNTALAATRATGPSHVLLISPDGSPGNLGRALEASGMRLRVAAAGESTLSSAELKGAAAVILKNVSLTSLGDRADSALRNYVREMGGGLLVTGGRNSFAGGGYYKSRLADVLPVSMERKDKFSRPPVAMSIVLDRSGSMGMSVAGGVMKMDLANRAASEAVKLLTEQDELSVFAVDSQAAEVVPLTGLGGNREGIQDRILSIEPGGGGIYVFNGLQAGVASLTDTDAPTRHILLFTDAADSEQPSNYRQLVKKWTNAGGTISVIGLGTEADKDAGLLKDIASRGGGRAMFTSDPANLPQVFTQDAMRVARKTFIKEQAAVGLTPALGRIGELNISSFPAVGGYNLCYPKEDADELAFTRDDNGAPLLAVWRRGMGRAAALTCPVSGKFSGALPQWEQYQPLFTTLLRWLEKDEDDPSLFGTIVRRGRSGRVVLEMDEKTAEECTGASAVIIPPGEKDTREIPLQWTSPRQMEATFELEKDGVYHGVVRTNGGKQVTLPPVALPYSPEFRPRPEGEGEEVMAELADATGGERLMSVEEIFAAGPVAASSGSAGTPLAAVLAALAVVLVLCDIITRKALWGHLLPRRAIRMVTGGGAAVRWGVRRVGRAVASLRPRRRGKQPTPEPDVLAEEEEADEEKEEEPGYEEREEGESADEKDDLFREAKRRSRGDSP
ncbi:MAG: VWA domain-containing protein, partial [Planctomycetota bacterium]